jgi:hypothetical protein
MERENLQAHLDKRFDRLEEKLDDHLGRISKAETEIHWIKGASKLALTLVISALGFLAHVFWGRTH